MNLYGKGDTTWFTHDRLGLFIHWGLYSMPARGEWVRCNEKMDEESYQIYFDLFDPDLFNPAEWAEAARRAGMKYFIMTAKHHDGFCLWDTKYTTYKATNTPGARDLVREVLDAFRSEGLRVGLYYSLLDWHHPDFTIDPLHPLWDKVDHDECNKDRDMRRYASYMRDQVAELLTDYGKVDIFWFDFSYPPLKGRDDWESEKLIRLVRSLQPDVIVDNRLDLPGSGDVITPEKFTPDAGLTDEIGNPVVWEGCQTFADSWGYHRDDAGWKSVEMCIQMLINHVSRNGNLLLNVGPTSRGYIDQRALDRLAGLADWMKYNSRSIYGCGAVPADFPPPPPDCRYTWNPETRRLYLHCFAWPFRLITLPQLKGKVRYAQLLADGSEIKIYDQSDSSPHKRPIVPKDALVLQFPVQRPAGSTVPVIELFLK